ncbi:DNA-directed RNA polymerase subunit beta [Mycoplasmopsis synoviae]
MQKDKKNYKLRKFGPITERRDYSITKHSLPVGDILATSKKSYQDFINKKIEELLNEIYPIEASNKEASLEYEKKSVKFELPFKKAEHENLQIKTCKAKKTNFSMKVYITLKKVVSQTGVVKKEKILLGEIPYITSSGSFIINGSEKVIVSQLIRSHGAYFGVSVRNKQSEDLFNKLEILPRIGSWIEVSHKVTSANLDAIKIKIDKNKNINIVTFLASFGLLADDIRYLFGKNEVLEETIRKNKTIDITEFSRQEIMDLCQEKIFRIIRKGDRISEESKRSLLSGMLFDKKRYNLSKTGRYMLNNKLSLVERITNTYLAQKVVSHLGNTFDVGTYVTYEIAKEIQESFEAKAKDNKSNLHLEKIPNINPDDVYYKINKDNKSLNKRINIARIKIWPTKRAMDANVTPSEVIGNDPKATEEHLLLSDIIAAISYYLNLTVGIGQDDDPDSLMNKRIVSVGELLEGELRIALLKLEKATRERMGAKEPDKITAKNVTNNKLITNQMKTFFNTSKLAQFMDQINPLAEISNKRRVTSLGPGGLNRDTAQFEVRDVHSTHYGRICPIETPEGPNIGLILNYAIYSTVNELGFLQTPYYKVNDGVVDYNDVRYLTSYEEIGYAFAQSSVHVNDKNEIIDEQITIKKDYNYIIGSPKDIDFLEVSSKQIVSVAAAAIPFLENNDANRALMGSNMQRQAVPLIEAEAPLVATGIEADIAKFSSYNIVANNDGEVIYVDGTKIQVRTAKKIDTYNLKNFEKSNQGTIIQQKPIVKVGDHVKEGDLLVDGSSFKDGEMALGKNLLVGFTTWNGYNFEDAIIINERLVKDDVLTSIYIEEQTIQFRISKSSEDIMTRDIPNVSKYSMRNLDEFGIIKVGSEVVAGDVLVGRISPKGEENPSQEEKLLNAIFNQRPQNYKDTSLKVKNGHNGTVIHVEVLSRENGDILEDGLDSIIKVYIAQKRKIKVGDKMAGRHGNKGVISIILPEEDMPHLEDGTPLDIMLNPQGVPSRMNIGQVLEMHLGMAAKKLGTKFVTPSFDGIKKETIEDLLQEANLDKSGKQVVIDPITGEKFDNPISVGVIYMLKLNHMVDDKMHARSVGPYSLITQQPLGGKSQNGGQRFGEMETWALESYGASNILQEILTYKSDDIYSRNLVYKALVNDSAIPNPGMPESFNVLSNELKGLLMKLGITETESNSDELIQHFDHLGVEHE